MLHSCPQRRRRPRNSDAVATTYRISCVTRLLLQNLSGVWEPIISFDRNVFLLELVLLFGWGQTGLAWAGLVSSAYSCHHQLGFFGLGWVGLAPAEGVSSHTRNATPDPQALNPNLTPRKPKPYTLEAL